MSDTYPSSPKPTPFEGFDLFRHVKLAQLASKEKKDRFEFILTLNEAINVCWQADKISLDSQEEVSPSLLLGKYSKLEGIANQGDSGRDALVLALEPKVDTGAMEMMYIILPINGSVDSYGDIPFSSDVLVLETKGSGRKKEISFKYICPEGIFTYCPIEPISDKSTQRLFENPAQIKHIGQHATEFGYTERIMHRITEEMEPVAHSDLPPDRRIINFTQDYFGKIKKDDEPEEPID